MKWNLLFRLKKFKKVDLFYLEMTIQTVQTLKKYLEKNCIQINKLCVNITFWTDTISNERLDTLLEATN
jgi:hypothetical protein